MKRLLICILLTLLLSGCFWDKDESSPKQEITADPEVIKKPKEFIYIHINAEVESESIFQVDKISAKKLYYFDSNNGWNHITGLTFETIDDYGIVKTDISKLKGSLIDTLKTHTLKFEATLEGDKVIQTIFKKGDKANRVVYVNSYTELFSQLVEGINNDDEISFEDKGASINEYLSFLELSDLNSDGFVTESDIGLYDASFNTAPKATMVLSKINQEPSPNSQTDVYSLVKEQLIESKKVWPFEVIQYSSSYVEMKIMDYLHDNVEGTYFSIKTNCKNLENSTSVLVAATDSFNVSDECIFSYQLCHDELGINCSGNDTLYYFDKVFSKHMPIDRVVKTNDNIGKFDIKGLKSITAFSEKYGKIENLKEAEVSLEVKEFLACQLIKQFNFACDDSEFSFN